MADERDESDLTYSYADKDRAHIGGPEEFFTHGDGSVDTNIKITHARCVNMIANNLMTNSDMRRILNCAKSTLRYDKFNSTCFILGYMVSGAGTVNMANPPDLKLIEIKKYLATTVKDILKEESNISEADVIRYARYWNNNSDCGEFS